VQIPYLYDERQDLARVYKAACAPDFYIFNAELELEYRVYLDDSRPKKGISLSGTSLSEALDAIFNNREVYKNQKSSMGCNIKWRKY
jgi:hypothetical protein